MGTIKARIIQSDKVCVDVHNRFPNSGNGYETTVNLYNKDGFGWVAEISFGDMPPQESIEDAIDRLSLYLKTISPVLKGKNFKHLNPEKIFNPKHVK